MIVVIFSTQYPFDTQLMWQFEDRSILRQVEDRFFSGASVVRAFTGSETELCSDFRGCNILFLNQCAVCFFLDIFERSGSLVILVIDPWPPRKAVQPFLFVLEHGFADILHFSYRFAYFPGNKDVILAGEKEILSGGIYVIFLDKG